MSICLDILSFKIEIETTIVGLTSLVVTISCVVNTPQPSDDNLSSMRFVYLFNEVKFTWFLHYDDGTFCDGWNVTLESKINLISSIPWNVSRKTKTVIFMWKKIILFIIQTECYYWRGLVSWERKYINWGIFHLKTSRVYDMTLCFITTEMLTFIPRSDISWRDFVFHRKDSFSLNQQSRR